jgi:hypothetical protein
VPQEAQSRTNDDTDTGNTKNKYFTDQAKALVSVSEATAACTTTVPNRAEPKNTRLVTQDNKSKRTRATAGVDSLGAALSAVVLERGHDLLSSHQSVA